MKTVKARKRYGANSLDLTIPAELVKKFEISAGDLFEIKTDDEKDLILTYRRIYEI